MAVGAVDGDELDRLFRGTSKWSILLTAAGIFGITASIVYSGFTLYQYETGQRVGRGTPTLPEVEATDISATPVPSSGQDQEFVRLRNENDQLKRDNRLLRAAALEPVPAPITTAAPEPVSAVPADATIVDGLRQRVDALQDEARAARADADNLRDRLSEALKSGQTAQKGAADAQQAAADAATAQAALAESEARNRMLERSRRLATERADRLDDELQRLRDQIRQLQSGKGAPTTKADPKAIVKPAG